jgi:hypothetical protein
MWGHWFAVVSVGALLLLLVVASAFLGSPLLALLIAAVALTALAAAYGLRRATGTDSAPATARVAENPLTNPRSPASGGAPIAGEGSEPTKHSRG